MPFDPTVHVILCIYSEMVAKMYMKKRKIFIATFFEIAKH